MNIDKEVFTSNFSFIEDKENAKYFLGELENRLRTDTVTDVDGQHFLYKLGGKTYKCAIVKLYSALAKLSLPLFDSTHNPCFIGLAIIATLDSLREAVSAVPADPAAVCQVFYNQYQQDYTLELKLVDLENAFAPLTGATSNIRERVANSLAYLVEKEIVETVPETESVKMIEFYLFRQH